MNPTLDYFWNSITTAFATRRTAVRRLARDDLQAPEPEQGAPFAGQQHLLARSTARHASPYYVAETITAALLALVSGIAAYMVATDVERSTLTMPTAFALAAVSALCLYQTVGRRFGPALIDGTRYEQARVALRESGEDHTRPLSVILATAMAAIFLVDGAFSGFTLTTTAFASIFTPRVAFYASAAWSCATAWLLFHLTSAAAHEGAVNARRSLIRNLLASPREADRERAEAMIKHVGHALGNDFSRGANRFRARVVLALVVAGLTAATLIVRVGAEDDGAMQAPPHAFGAQQP